MQHLKTAKDGQLGKNVHEMSAVRQSWSYYCHQYIAKHGNGHLRKQIPFK